MNTRNRPIFCLLSYLQVPTVLINLRDPEPDQDTDPNPNQERKFRFRIRNRIQHKRLGSSWLRIRIRNTGREPYEITVKHPIQITTQAQQIYNSESYNNNIRYQGTSRL